MYSLTLTLIFITQIYCEWVEISQHYNYKKPLRPTHTHPLLASTTPKQDELEKATVRNRIYINHSVPDYNWKTGSNQLFKDDFFMNSAVDFHDRDDFANKRPPSDKNKDVLIIRRGKPENPKNKIKKENLKNVLNPEYDKEITKTLPDDKLDNGRPLDEYKGPIEVLNLSELEYTTADDITSIKLNENESNNNNLKRKDYVFGNNTPPDSSKGSASRHKTPEATERKNLRPEQAHNTKPPLLKTTSMRRVNIIRSTSTYRTPTQQFEEEEDYQSNTPVAPRKPSEITEVKAKVRQPTSPYRFPHIGHVKRVNITNTVRTTPKPSKKDYKSNPNLENDEDKFAEDSTADKNNKAIRRIDNPVTSNERVRTNPTKFKAHKTRYDNKNDYKNVTPEDIMVEEILKEDEGKRDFTVHKVASLGNIQRVQNPTDPQIGKRKNTMINNITVTSPPKPEINSDDVFMNEESNDRFDKVHRVNFLGSTEEASILATVKYKTKNIATERPEEVAQIERYQPNPHAAIRPSREPMPEFVTKDENFNNGDSKNNFESSTENVFELKPTEPSNEITPRPTHLGGKDNGAKPQRQENENKEQKNGDPTLDKTKPSAIENLIKFLKTVTAIISRNSRRGVLGKVRYLEDLRDTILANIEERLEAAFPDDDEALRRHGRRGRSAAAADARGHVEFPSSESALMTISFLTFAVFLIKLILQVIQAYKNKTMMVMPTVISAAVGRAFAAGRNDN